MHGVQREKGGHEGAAPKGAGEPPEQDKEQGAVGQMEEKVYQVEGPRPHPEQGDI
jgi:hypothetical protein